MQPSDLDRALADLARQPVPSLPSSFQNDVWRTIRQRKAAPQGFRSLVEDWLAAFLRPQAVAGALAFSLVVGAFAGASGAQAAPTSTAKAMQLAAFSTRTPGLPSTLLEGRR